MITVAPDPGAFLRDGVSVVDACKRLEDMGAAVVGINCMTSPQRMVDEFLPSIREACKVSPLGS